MKQRFSSLDVKVRQTGLSAPSPLLIDLGFTLGHRA